MYVPCYSRFLANIEQEIMLGMNQLGQEYDKSNNGLLVSKDTEAAGK